MCNKNFAKIIGKCLCQSLFYKKEALAQLLSVNFAKFLKTSSLTEYLRWLLLTFQSESSIYTLRTSCSKQAQYLNLSEQKIHENINVQTQFKQVFFAMLQLLDSFNKNLLRQRGLDKYFQDRFLLGPTFSYQCQNIRKGTLPQTLKSNFSLLQFTIKSRITCQSKLNMSPS